MGLVVWEVEVMVYYVLGVVKIDLWLTNMSYLVTVFFMHVFVLENTYSMFVHTF